MNIESTGEVVATSAIENMPWDSLVVMLFGGAFFLGFGALIIKAFFFTSGLGKKE